MNGTGVAIGFDASIFPRHKLLPHTYASPWDNTSLWPVIYNAIEQRELVGAMFNNALVSPDICVKDGGRPNYQILGALIAAVNPVLKNPAFSEEKEWRVIHSPQITTNAENKHDVLGSSYTIGQRVSGDQIVTHFEFPLPQALIGAVTEIWIGPRSRLTKSDLELSLGINGFGKVLIKASSATYR